ncbi:MAG TPA: hypothetical protein VKK19_13960 [Candidatus Dormibacteraeota bacterium]|nr:hypothetical protein [Candidatus Dormibacteraeota bacterium]
MLTFRLWWSVLMAVTVAGGVILLVSGCLEQGGSGGSSSPVAARSPSASSLAERAVTSARPTSNPVRTAPRRPASTPRPSQGPSLSAIYASSLQVDAQHLVAANGDRQASCAGNDLAGCRSALQRVSTWASALQRDLDAHPAPACLTTADATLRSAIALFLQGAQVGTKGIDEGISADIIQGKSLLDQGTTRLMAASTQLGQSGCSAPPPNVAP